MSSYKNLRIDDMNGQGGFFASAIQNTVSNQTNCIALLSDPIRYQQNKKTAFVVIFFFFDFPSRLSQFFKNLVKINWFNEPKCQSECLLSFLTRVGLQKYGAIFYFGLNSSFEMPEHPLTRATSAFLRRASD